MVPDIQIVADKPSEWLLALWVNFPWMVEWLMLFAFLYPIFKLGGKKADFDEKTLGIFAGVFAAAVVLSFQIIGINFAHFVGWIVLVFCIIVAVAAWKTLIHGWVNEKYHVSIPVAVLLFTYMFSFISSMGKASPNLGVVPTVEIFGYVLSDALLSFLRIISFWLLVLSALFALNAHMAPWDVKTKKKELGKWWNKRSQQTEQKRKKEQFVKELSNTLGYDVKDEVSALGKYLAAGEKAVDSVAKAITNLEGIGAKLATGKNISVKDSTALKMSVAAIADKKNQVVSNAKTLLEKIKKTNSSLSQASTKLGFTDLSETSKKLNDLFKELEKRITKSPLRKHNQQEQTRLNAELAQLDQELQGLDPKIQSVTLLDQTRQNSLTEVHTKGLDNLASLIADVESVIKKLSSNEEENSLNLLASSVGRSPAEVGGLVTSAISKLRDLLNNINIEEKATHYEAQLDQLSVYINSINKNLTQLLTIVNEVRPKQNELNTKYLTLMNSLEGNENALKASGKVITDVNQLINLINTEISALKQSYTTSLDVVSKFQKAFTRTLKDKKSGSVIDPQNKVFEVMTQLEDEVKKITIGENVAKATFSKIKHLLDNLKDIPQHTAEASTLLSRLETEEAQITENLGRFKTNVTNWISSLNSKIINSQQIDPAEIRQIVESIASEARSVNKFIEDLEAFVVQLKIVAAQPPAAPQPTGPTITP